MVEAVPAAPDADPPRANATKPSTQRQGERRPRAPPPTGRRSRLRDPRRPAPLPPSRSAQVGFLAAQAALFAPGARAWPAAANSTSEADRRRTAARAAPRTASRAARRTTPRPPGQYPDHAIERVLIVRSRTSVSSRCADNRDADGRTLCVHDGGDPSGFPVLMHHGTPAAGYIPRTTRSRGQKDRLLGYDRPRYGGSTRTQVATSPDCARRDCDRGRPRSRFGSWGISGAPHVLACGPCDVRLVAPRACRGAPYDAGFGSAGLGWAAGRTTSSSARPRGEAPPPYLETEREGSSPPSQSLSSDEAGAGRPHQS